MSKRPIQHTSLDRLRRDVANGKSIRVGSTLDPVRRNSQYRKTDGHRYENCVMKVAETDNMMADEDELLNAGLNKFNVHRLSNAPQSPGYVYGYVKRGYQRRYKKKKQRGWGDLLGGTAIAYGLFRRIYTSFWPYSYSCASGRQRGWFASGRQQGWFASGRQRGWFDSGRQRGWFDFI